MLCYAITCQLKKLFLFIPFHESKKYLIKQKIAAPMHPSNPRTVNPLVDNYFTLSTIKLWNSLPNSIEKSETFNNFKREIHS